MTDSIYGSVPYLSTSPPRKMLKSGEWGDLTLQEAVATSTTVIEIVAMISLVSHFFLCVLSLCRTLKQGDRGGPDAGGRSCNARQHLCIGVSLNTQVLVSVCRALKQGDRGDLTLEEAVATSDGGPAAKVGLLLEDHEKTLQDLVSQIVTYWKVGCGDVLKASHVTCCMICFEVGPLLVKREKMQ